MTLAFSGYPPVFDFVEPAVRRVDWWFDFISPFSYFAFHRLPTLPADVTVVYRPVLFAGLLQHWGQKGPAEIAPKRRWTYRWCVWWAQQHGVPFVPPAVHPFNPLPYLRLSIAAGGGREAIGQIFDALWTTGADPRDPAHVAQLQASLGIAPAALQDDTVKAALRHNTEAAASADVFGVPTLRIEGESFWGVDAMPFAAAVLADPGLLQTPLMRRVDALPVGVMRGSATPEPR